MDNQARKKFWDTLCSLDGIDLKKDERKLVDAMQYPRHLYRLAPWMGCRGISYTSQVQIIMMIHLTRFCILTLLKSRMK